MHSMTIPTLPAPPEPGVGQSGNPAMSAPHAEVWRHAMQAGPAYHAANVTMDSAIPHEEAGRATGAGADRLVAEKLLAYFFRDEPLRLYACVHMPASAADAEAVLICQPTGHEYERCHKAMRQLAVQLARAGHPVMRFDYSGSGDSAGDCDKVSLAQWRADIGDAIDECRRVTGRQRVSVIGLRLGATLAAQVVAGRDDVDRLILYAPVTDGQALLAEWQEAQAEHDRKHSHAAVAPAQAEVLGMPITDVLHAGLLHDLVVSAPRRAMRRVLILAEPTVAAQLHDLPRVLAGEGAVVNTETDEAPAIWRREPMEAIVPIKLIRRVVAWMNEVAR